MTETVKLSLKKKLLFLSVPAVVLLGGAEIALRLQQHFGPKYDLEMAQVTRGSLSETLNHRPDTTQKKFTLGNKNIYGSHAGTEYEQAYDEDGIQITRLRPGRDAGRPALLFMGDSFMQGYDEAHTIPHHAFQFISKRHPELAKHAFLNAGYFSYSPSIFIPQTRALLPKLRPQFVVVVIDETDLGDDFFRYQKLATRRTDGRIDSIRPSPPNAEFVRGAEWMRSQPLFLMRLFVKERHSRVTMPRLLADYRSQFQFEDDLPPLPLPDCDDFTGRLILKPIRHEEAGARRRFADAIAYFEKTLDDLCLTLMEGGVPANRILLVRHPHQWHLMPGPEGRPWNRIAAATIGKAAAKHRVTFYDAQDDLAAAFGADPSLYYWKQDIHFNFEGLKIYSELIAERFECLLLTRSASTAFTPATSH